jgi:uridine kinase
MQGPRTVEQLGDLVTRLHHQPRRKLTLLVGIDGPGGAGKSSLARALASLDPAMTIVAMDAFHRPAAERPRAQGEAPEIAADVDWRRLRNQVLLPLQRNRLAQYQAYDREADCLLEWRQVPVGGIVLVEGVYACMKQLASGYDFRIWVVPRRGEPGRDRHGGATSSAETSPVSAEEAYIAAHDPAGSADLIVDASGAVAHDPSREYVRIRPAPRG